MSTYNDPELELAIMLSIQEAEKANKYTEDMNDFSDTDSDHSDSDSVKHLSDALPNITNITEGECKNSSYETFSTSITGSSDVSFERVKYCEDLTPAELKSCDVEESKSNVKLNIDKTEKMTIKTPDNPYQLMLKRRQERLEKAKQAENSTESPYKGAKKVTYLDNGVIKHKWV